MMSVTTKASTATAASTGSPRSNNGSNTIGGRKTHSSSSSFQHSSYCCCIVCFIVQALFFFQLGLLSSTNQVYYYQQQTEEQVLGSAPSIIHCQETKTTPLTTPTPASTKRTTSTISESSPKICTIDDIKNSAASSSLSLSMSSPTESTAALLTPFQIYQNGSRNLIGCISKLPNPVTESSDTVIPKIFHFAWISIGLNGSNSMPSHILYLIGEWQALHPEWTVLLWTNDMIKIHFPELIELITQLYNESWGSNIIRYAVLEKFGGIYMDTDVEVVASVNRLVDLYTSFTVCAKPHSFPPSSISNIDNDNPSNGEKIIATASSIENKHCERVGTAVIGTVKHHPALYHSLQESITNSYDALTYNGTKKYDRYISGTFVWTPIALEYVNVTKLYSSTFFPCHGSCKESTHPRRQFSKDDTIFAVHRGTSTWQDKLYRSDLEKQK